MFKSLKIMQDSLARHAEAFHKLCNTTDGYCQTPDKPPLKVVETRNNHARPA